MMKSIFTTLFLSIVAFGFNLNAQVTIDNTDLTNPPATSCTATFYTVSGVMSNTNYGYSGPSITVVGFSINIDMNYFSGFAPMPGLTPYSENIDLGTLPVGNYSVTTTTYVDGNLSNIDMGTFGVVSCCTITADFTLSSLTTCASDTVWTTNLSTGGATNYAWYIDGAFLINAPNTGISPTTGGVHTIKLLAYDLNCSDSMVQTLEVFIPADVHLGNDTSLCEGDSLVLDVTTPMATYEWQDGSTSPTFTVDTAGIYWAAVTDSNGCVSIDSITVVPCSVGLNEITSSESILIYPNPAVSTIQLLGLEGKSSVTIISLTGAVVAVHSNTDTIDISTLESGAYLVKITQNNNTFTKRLIVRD